MQIITIVGFGLAATQLYFGIRFTQIVSKVSEMYAGLDLTTPVFNSIIPLSLVVLGVVNFVFSVISFFGKGSSEKTKKLSLIFIVISSILTFLLIGSLMFSVLYSIYDVTASL